jgi:hypothetical protein
MISRTRRRCPQAGLPALLLTLSALGPHPAVRAAPLALRCELSGGGSPEVLLIRADPDRSEALVRRSGGSGVRPAQASFTDRRLTVSYLEEGRMSRPVALVIDRRSGRVTRSGSAARGRCRALRAGS